MGQHIDKATIVNRALVRIGQAPSFSLDDENFANGSIDGIWPDCVARCFSLHDWTFARRTRRLTRVAGENESGWPYAFDLPGDRLGPPLKILRAVFPQDAVIRDYAIEGNQLYASEPEVWARCKVDVDPAAWDAAFRSAFITALAARLAVPMQQDEGLASELEAMAFGSPAQGGTGGEFGRLIAQDRAAGPISSPLLRNDPLTEARYS
ncbi:hypothetical protein [Aureimonas sp. AU12]|uniref:hypothetical protein n=1 Tax=Aureimonas sp. AU12 TaxID=1638161 RepID=UPI0007819966|nr:hypothetical protein [Aureimonas sp. AU12]